MSDSNDKGPRLGSWWGLTLIAAAFAVAVLGFAYLAGFVWPKVFDLEALQLLGANLIGVLLAAFFALEIERRIGEMREDRKREAAREARREEALRALEALRHAIEHNQSELDDVVHSLKLHPVAPIFSSADPRALDPILPQVVDTVGDFEMIRQASTLRHELEEFNRMVRAQLDLYLLPEFHPHRAALRTREGQKIQELRNTLIEKAIQYGERVTEHVEELLIEIQGSIEAHTRPSGSEMQSSPLRDGSIGQKAR